MQTHWLRGVVRIVLTTIIAAGPVASVGSPASAAVPVLTLSSATGPSGGGNTITGTSSAMAFPAGVTPVVQFQYVGAGSSSCSSTAQAPTQIAATGTTATAGVLTVDPAQARRITTTKLALTVPSSAYPAFDDYGNPSTVNPQGLVLTGSQTSARWNLCVYDTDSTTSSTLLAVASYTVAIRPTIGSISPASGPSGGGQTITVNGTGFAPLSAPITGSIDGSALTDIRVTASGTSLTATTGPHTAGSGFALTLNTPGGPVSSLNPDNDPTTNDTPIPYSYSNGIAIAPNTAPVGSTVSVDVYGAGFSQLNFTGGGTPADGYAHVFLVKDAYAPASNRGVAECGNVVVISDNELICTLNLAADQLNPVDSSVEPGTPIVDGAYMLTVVATGDPNASLADANPTIVSSGAAFIVAPY